MNWPGLLVAFGALCLALHTMPWGLLILLGLAWLYSRG